MGDKNIEIGEGVEGIVNAEGSTIHQHFGDMATLKQKDPKHLTSLPPINTNFIGREDDLKAIEKNLSSDNVVCVVNGIGGVGKSELSYKYLHDNKEKYNKIAFIEFTEESRSLEETFYFKFQDTFQLTEKDTLETIIKRLQGLKPKNLMVLDNLQSNEDFNKIKALNTNFDLLITTRAKFDSPNILNLETLNDADAKELFLEKALKIKEEILGKNHPSTALSYNNLGLFYQERKECEKAKKYLEKAIASVEELEYSDISLIDLRRWLREVEKSMVKEKKAKFNKKGKFCKDG